MGDRVRRRYGAAEGWAIECCRVCVCVCVSYFFCVNFLGSFVDVVALAMGECVCIYMLYVASLAARVCFANHIE